MSNEKTTPAAVPTDEALQKAFEEYHKAIKEEIRELDADNPQLRGISETVLAQVISMVENAEALFATYSDTISSLERTRLNSVRLKNSGFVQTAYNSAVTHTALVPSWLNMTKFHNDLNDYMRKQQLMGVVKELEQIVDDSLLVAGDKVYSDALIYYNALRDETKANVPGAKSEYALLKPHFQHAKPKTAEPTQKEIERDVESLLHGTKEGKVVIENHLPQAEHGKLTVSDETEQRKELYRSDTYTEEKA